jgi:outer membrane murein-binding lipoprotein Lpp
MRKTIMAAMAAASLIAISGCKQQAATNEAATNVSTENAAATASAGDISGTWKADVNSVQFDTKPDEYLLQNGTYSCKSCTPAYTVAADGADHPVKLPYADTDNVKVVDDHTVKEVLKKGGKQVNEATTTISADGNTSTTAFTDTTAPGAPAKGEFVETRVGAAPAGAHAISGQWKPTKLSNFNDAALTFTVNVSGDTYKLSSPDGTSFEAKIGGPEVPIKGDIANTMVSVTKDGNSYKTTRKRDGKVVGTTTVTLGADGRLHAESKNEMNGAVTRWIADKQS